METERRRDVFRRWLGWIVSWGCLWASAGAQVAVDPPVQLAEVVVTPSRFGISDDRSAVSATLTQSELETLPQFGEDLYRSIARLPGVAADDFTARFWIRGAPNAQVLARLDGIDLIEPFHLKDIDGALSIVDLPSISRLDLVTGGFTAEFGDRLAGVLTLETATAPRATAATSLGVSLTGVRASHAGRFAQGRGAWRVTARRGYPDLALKLEGRDDEVFPRYYDGVLKVDWSLSPRHRISFQALHAGDTLKFRDDDEPELQSRYGSDYAWLRWQGEPRDGWVGEAVLSYSHLTWNRRGTGFFDQRLRLDLDDDRDLSVLAFRNDWTLALSDRLVLRGGVEAKTAGADYSYVLLREENVVVNGAQGIDRRTADVHLSPAGQGWGLFVSPRIQVSRSLVIEAGARLDHDPARGDTVASPRFNASWSPGSGTTVRMAWGGYRQAQGLQELSVADGQTAFQEAERAEHRVVGIEHRLRSGVLLRAEVYQRLGRRVRERWDNPVNLYNVFPEIQSDRTRMAPSENSARGIELMVARRVRRGWGWSASYALARSEEMVEGRTVPTARDQRHTVFADATYVPNARWSFSAAWQFHTGWPTTDVGYVLIPLNNGRRFVQRVVGPVYGKRLPAYHRLDLRATRRWELKRGELRVFADLFNAYDHANLLGYTYRANVQGSQVTAQPKPKELLPVLPSLGVEYEF